jgi:hypothetical protein
MKLVTNERDDNGIDCRRRSRARLFPIPRSTHPVPAKWDRTGVRHTFIGIAAYSWSPAFVATDPQVLAVVQRADGVARIVGNNLTKAQITAVARAVATP